MKTIRRIMALLPITRPVQIIVAIDQTNVITAPDGTIINGVS